MSATRREDGFVMIAVIVVMTLALMLGGIVVASSVSARRPAEQRLRDDRSQAAADTGLAETLYRANQFDLSQVDLDGSPGQVAAQLLCQARSSPAGATPAAGAQVNVASFATVSAAAGCPSGATPPAPPDPSTPPPLVSLGNREAYRSWFVDGDTTSLPGAGQGHLHPAIVSEGHDTMGTATESDDVIRRTELILEPIDPLRVVEATGNVTFGALATTVNGNVRANGDLSSSLAVTGVNVLSGGAIVDTSDVEYGGASSGTFVPAPRRTSVKLDRPAPVTPAIADCPSTCPAGYSATTRRFAPTSDVTLPSGDYAFCAVDVPDGVTLRTAQTGAPVRIYVDPARCPGGVSDKGDLKITGQLNPGVSLDSARLQLYLAGNAGSGSTTTAEIGTGVHALPVGLGLVSVTNALTTNFVLYAPTSDVRVKFTTFTGAIIGHDVTLMGASPVSALGVPIPGVAAVLTQDLGLADSPLAPGVGALRPQQYVDCSRSRVSGPDYAAASSVLSGC